MIISFTSTLLILKIIEILVSRAKNIKTIASSRGKIDLDSVYQIQDSILEIASQRNGRILY